MDQAGAEARTTNNNATFCGELQGAIDPLNIAPLIGATMRNAWLHPGALMEHHSRACFDYIGLWHATARAWLGDDAAEVALPDAGDSRFRDPAWQHNPWFNLLKQSYLIACRSIRDSIAEFDDLDAKTAKRLSFFSDQLLDSVAPGNFAAGNPQVLRETIESGGENLVRGWRNLLRDMGGIDGQPGVSMCAPGMFEIGVNLATTPGSVVYQNDLMQLIQYSPASETQRQVPLLIVPPWINKYYVLDLQARNSFVRWLTGQGHTVFIVSWVNPDASLANKDFEDYLLEGTLAALEAIEQATGEPRVNAIGYCLGGTLIAATLAYLQATGAQQRIESATLLTTLIDFAEPGDLGVFLDEQQVANLERKMFRDGYLDGSSMASTFSVLRANDLVWSFVINNYLLGKQPPAWDLLHWNADSTRMPARMHSFYLRNMYLRNLLREPGGMQLAGVSLDMTRVKTPAYFLSAEDDHIAPWRSTFSGAQLFRGPVRFVLGESGHIAGVINPPDKGKYGFRTGKLRDSADDWHASSRRHDGSWWLDWLRWIEAHAGEQVPARHPGDHQLPILEAAPGSYVNAALDEHAPGN